MVVVTGSQKLGQSEFLTMFESFVFLTPSLPPNSSEGVDSTALAAFQVKDYQEEETEENLSHGGVEGGLK